MCEVDKVQEYTDKWEDYFEFVNTEIYRKLLFEDELYIAFGVHHQFPVENIKSWYKDAEQSFVSKLYPDQYIIHKYGDHAMSSDDIEYFIDQEFQEGTLYESAGYWFHE